MKLQRLYKKILGVAVMLGASALSSTAFAGLVINVTDNGGMAEFSFSGSAVVTAAGSVNNGFWMNDLKELGAYTGMPNFTGKHTIVSGAATFDINNVSYGINDVWVNADSYDHELSFRSHTNPFSVAAGSVLGLSGSILTDLNFDWFNQGSYNLYSVGPFDSSEAKIGGGYVLNVVAVPEPGSLALLMLGLGGLVASRKLNK